MKSEQEIREAVAHVLRGKNGEWLAPHLLEDHIKSVADLAATFAAGFGHEDWARLAGLWHDLGKYQPDFQNYIRRRSGYEADESMEGGPGRIDHSIVGALWAFQRYRDAYGEAGNIPAAVLGYLIAGHHAGLPDWDHTMGTGGALENRLRDSRPLLSSFEGKPAQEILNAALASSQPCGFLPPQLAADTFPRQFHLWIRMLFSCLVDADFLDTEAYMDAAASTRRHESQIDLAEAKRRLDRHLERLSEHAAPTPVNLLRIEVLAACRRAAKQSSGVFSLTVPTGGGKTLASMAFALEHALVHGKRRVIVAIPFTSIIEQTAEVYRGVFGEEAVLEHHCSMDPDKETQRSRLASENWDAPVIVTTNVQLFESLYASRTSSCRKLHNLADSVIILDEVQTLQVEYLEPIVEAMKGLVSLFGATIVLSTATQPVLAGTIESGTARLTGFRSGSVNEIIPDPSELSKKLTRTRLQRFHADDSPVSWEELAKAISSHEQALCIVNTRKDCRELHGLLPAGAVHLSALMCPEHRTETISKIKSALAAGLPIRVVSTQLVEAGVDIDFPVVYRAFTGFDSIAQAAGRCNREGRLNEKGRLGQVIIFTPPHDAPPGMLRKASDAGREIFRRLPPDNIRLEPETFSEYFKAFYSRANSFDHHGIMNLLAGPDVSEAKLQFRSAAARFTLIEDGGQCHIITLFEGAKGRKDSRSSINQLIEKVENFGPDRTTMRRLQRNTVSIPRRGAEALLDLGAIREMKNMPGLYIQASPGLYDKTFGLRLEGPLFNPFDFIS